MIDMITLTMLGRINQLELKVAELESKLAALIAPPATETPSPPTKKKGKNAK